MNDFTNYILTHLSEIGSLVTAFTAVFAYLSYRFARARRVRKLQTFFRREDKRIRNEYKQSGHPLPDNAYIEKSIAELVACVWLSPDQVMDAIFHSTNLLTAIDKEGADIWSRIKVRYMSKAELRRTVVKV